jgi:hypothetical protein
MSADDMCSKLQYLTEHYEEIKSRLTANSADDNVGRMADWLAGESQAKLKSEVVHAG